MDVTNFQVAIDSSKLSIHLSGSFISYVADPFIALFKSLIVDKIKQAMNNDVPKKIKEVIAEKILESNGYLNFPQSGLALDFQIPETPQVTDTQIGVFFNATFFNST